MARGRFVTNTLGDSEKFSVLKSDTHRTAYILLVTWADAEGRFLADPVTLKGKLYTRLPWTPDTVEAALLDMHDVGLIHLYNVNGKRYGSVDKFHEHNKIYRKPNGEPRDEAPSRIPAPPEGETRPAPDEPTSNPRVTRVQPAGAPRATHVEVEVEGKGNGSSTSPPTPPAVDEAEEAKEREASRQARRHDHRVLQAHHPDVWRALGELTSTYDWKAPQHRKVAERLLELTRDHGGGKVVAAIDKVLLNAGQVKWPIAFVEKVLTQDAASQATGAASPLTSDEELDRIFGVA
jgi:hypothetical protein